MGGDGVGWRGEGGEKGLINLQVLRLLRLK